MFINDYNLCNDRKRKGGDRVFLADHTDDEHNHDHDHDDRTCSNIHRREDIE